MSTVKSFIKHHFRHFNAATVVDAAEAWCRHLENGGKMFLTMAGAMSTAEMGIVVAELIRQGKIHGISLTGANLEEDVFNLVAREHYARVPRYRELSPHDELKLYERGMNRVTDTCIPEEEAMRVIERKVLAVWQKAEAEGRRVFPQEAFYELIKTGALKEHYQIDPKDSWLIAAVEKNIPLWVPGWEDSTLGNMFVANYIKGNIKSLTLLKSGMEQMATLVQWYRETSAKHSVGFFQIGGGIAGDFPICVVPLIEQDLGQKVPKWGYFCQISDSTTSYGSYSGAVPNEKITWGKLDVTTPSFIIESDASIVFPLVAAYVLDM